MNRTILAMPTLALTFVPVLGWAAEPNTEQAKAIAEIEKFGRVSVDEESLGKPVIHVCVMGEEVTDGSLECLSS